jgi:hypothetical protein
VGFVPLKTGRTFDAASGDEAIRDRSFLRLLFVLGLLQVLRLLLGEHAVLRDLRQSDFGDGIAPGLPFPR